MSRQPVRRVGIITPAWYNFGKLGIGGTETANYVLALGLCELGIEVTVFGPGQSEPPDGVEYVALTEEAFRSRSNPVSWFNWEEALAYYSRVIEELERRCPFDLIHTTLSSVTDKVQYPLLKGLDVPITMTGHTRWPLDPSLEGWGPTQEREPLLQWMRQYPLVAPSRFAQDNILNFLNPVGFVHHGMVPQSFQPVNTQDTPSQFNQPLPDHYAAWIGTITPGKAPHLGIEAVRKYNETAEQPLAFIMMGIVDMDVPLQREYYQNQIQPELDEHIRYLGPASFAQKAELLSGARVFLNPTTWEETFGYVITEPQGVGTPWWHSMSAPTLN